MKIVQFEFVTRLVPEEENTLVLLTDEGFFYGRIRGKWTLLDFGQNELYRDAKLREKLPFRELDLHFASEEAKKYPTKKNSALKEKIDKKIKSEISQLLPERKIGKKDYNFLDTRVEEMNISRRTVKVLLENRIKTVSDMLAVGKDKIFLFPGFGIQSMREVSREISARGFVLM